MVNRRSARSGVRSSGAVAVVDLERDLEHAAIDLRATVAQLAADGRRAVVLNLSGVRRVGVAGLGALLGAATAAARAGVALHAVCPARTAIPLMALTRIAVCFDVHDSETAALDAIRAETAHDARLRRVA